jgi:hypothetical protein
MAEMPWTPLEAKSDSGFSYLIYNLKEESRTFLENSVRRIELLSEVMLKSEATKSHGEPVHNERGLWPLGGRHG